MNGRGNPVRKLRKLIEDTRGASAVEFALVGMALIVLSLGVIEFGRAFLVRNALADAADVAVRTALLDRGAADQDIAASARQAFEEKQALLQVAFENQIHGGVQFKVMTLSYPVTLLIPLPRTETLTMSVTRRIRA